MSGAEHLVHEAADGERAAATLGAAAETAIDLGERRCSGNGVLFQKSG